MLEDIFPVNFVYSTGTLAELPMLVQTPPPCCWWTSVGRRASYSIVHNMWTVWREGRTYDFRIV